MILDNNARDMFENTFKVRQNTFFVSDWIVIHFWVIKLCILVGYCYFFPHI